MKILVTGVNGQLGYDVIRRLEVLSKEIENLEFTGVDIKDFDLTDYEETRNYITNYRPDVIVHCAAYTAVDRAEDETDLCFRVNVTGTENIAKVCREIDAKLIYISTDYVFSNAGDTPHNIDDEKSPINYYGETKLLGENKVKELVDKYFIVRTSWVFGVNGSNFVKNMLKLGSEKDEISVVADQVGSPTYTVDLAVLLCEMLFTEKYGTYHATNEGYCSWYEFACEIFRIAKIEVEVVSVSSEEYITKAKRSKNSRLSKKSLNDNGFNRLPNWKVALTQYISTIK